MIKIAVIGMGPGSPDYVTPAAVKTARRCDVLAGSERLLKLLAELDPAPEREQLKIEIKGELGSLVEGVISQHSGRMVGFLVSGDPGVYSLLALLKRHFPGQEIEVIPGISSVQYLFARLNKPWQDCRIVSLHGRSDRELLAEVRRCGPVAVLTDQKNTPRAVAGRLIEQGVTGKRAHVGMDLAGPREKIVSGSLEYISRIDSKEMSVMVIEDE